MKNNNTTMNRELAERIEKMINKHDRNYITLYTDDKLRTGISTIYYSFGKCKVEFCEYLEKWEFVFKSEHGVDVRLDCNVVGYSMMYHELYLK